MVVLVACKNEEDLSKNEGSRVVTTLLPLSVYGVFSNAQGQLTPQSLVDLAEFQTHLRFYGCPRHLQE